MKFLMRRIRKDYLMVLTMILTEQNTRPRIQQSNDGKGPRKTNEVYQETEDNNF